LSHRNRRWRSANEQNVKTPSQCIRTTAPAVYITSNPGRQDSSTRFFERAVSKLTAVNPITGNTDNITAFLADPVELKLLHMITDDPARTPTFVLFADSNYFLFAGAQNCSSPCVVVNRHSRGITVMFNPTSSPPGSVWWAGRAGEGVDADTWSDHTDIRPTMLVLAT